MTNSITRPVARRRRRSGRLRQDRADGRAVQAAARSLRDRGDHQRHLHQVGRRISGALRRARARAHRRRRDRRLPAHRDPRGCLDQSRRGVGDAKEISRSRSGADRIRRRQSRGDLLAGARRPDDLRDRRGGRRQDSVEGRARHHALRSAGHQQGRSRALCRRVARGDAARREENARRAAVRDDQPARPATASPTSPASSRTRAGLAPS